MFFNLFKALSAKAALLAAASDSDAIAEAIDLGFKFEPDNFLQSLPTIVSFTLSIFVVMAVIIIVTALLNWLTSGKKKKADNNGDNA